MPISGKEMINHYLKAEWKVLRWKGSHIIVGKDKQRETIPVHKGLKKDWKSFFLKNLVEVIRMYNQFKIHKEEDEYWAECIELKESATQGDIFHELQKNIEEVLNLYLDGLIIKMLHFHYQIEK